LLLVEEGVPRKFLKPALLDEDGAFKEFFLGDPAVNKYVNIIQ
jgi:hypothetical protein